MKIKNRNHRNRINHLCEAFRLPWMAFPPIPDDQQILFCKRDRNDFAFMSNFYPCRLVIDGQDWNHVEAYYQAQKSDNPAYREKILKKNNPRWAKRIGDSRIGHPRIAKKSWFRKHPDDLRADWESIKLDVMRKALRAKFHQNHNLMRALKQTGSVKLMEDSFRDNFWGAGEDGQGSNWLGIILMEIRGSLLFTKGNFPSTA